jgi:hypothetical protein
MFLSGIKLLSTRTFVTAMAGLHIGDYILQRQLFEVWDLLLHNPQLILLFCILQTHVLNQCQLVFLQSHVQHYILQNFFLLRDFSPQANYTDRATATSRRSLMPTFADKGCRVVSATIPHGCCW